MREIIISTQPISNPVPAQAEIYEIQNNDDLITLKSNFLMNLGAEDNRDLFENILKKSFRGDSFERNNENIFKNFYQKNNGINQDFLQEFSLFAQNKIDTCVNTRKKIAIANSVGLAGAFLMNFFLTPLAGIPMAIGVTLVSSVAEGVAKRNMANIGHLERHFGDKIEQATNDFIENSNKLLTPEAQEKIRLLKYKDKNSQSAILRGFNYISGALVSGVEKITNRFITVAENVALILTPVIGSIIPILPIINYKIAEISTRMRHNTAKEKFDYLRKVVEIVFDEQNLNSSMHNKTEDLKKSIKAFAFHIATSDVHGRVVGEKKFHPKPTKDYAKDTVKNPSKWITFSSFASAKINKFSANLFYKISGSKALRQDDVSLAPKKFTGFKFNESRNDESRENPVPSVIPNEKNLPANLIELRDVQLGKNLIALSQTR
jgi:hypothetical protein